jgi:hypothetical protein
LGGAVLTSIWLFVRVATGAESPAVARFQDDVQPILIDYCYRCHADGMKKGNVAFDGFASDEAMVANRDFWWAVLKNVRAGIMPPAKEPRPTPDEIGRLGRWIKGDVFGLDPENADPGRVTMRRLNRVEYHNTIRELMGIEFKAEEEFPPDDAGYGFDNIGDVLTVSPLLLEKYFQAAETIVTAAVPTSPMRMPERAYRGVELRGAERSQNGDRLPFSRHATVSRLLGAGPAGTYRLALELAVQGDSRQDPVRCTVTIKLDDRELRRDTYGWHQNRILRYQYEQHLASGDHRLSFEVQPELPDGLAVFGSAAPREQAAPGTSPSSPGAVDFRVISVRLQGPLGSQHLTRVPGYRRFFSRDEPPTTDPDRRRYARDVLSRFATKAFRRPVDDRTIDRLVAIAEAVYRLPGKRFEEGVTQAMVAVLASPRFVFRTEDVSPAQPTQRYALIDEYSLASRLSYFLWSTMPDDELFGLAGRGALRMQLGSQVARMLKDARSRALAQNFVGQWLQVRDLDGMFFNERAILRREGLRLQGADTERNVLTRDMRRAMRSETELAFEHVVHEDKSVLDWIDCDYTFLNARLAKYYGIPGVDGSEMRRVTLAKGSPRGGVLTHGSILALTSNPTRTSAVKRGQFILDNILGTPAPPPPAEVPALEASRKDFKDREPTSRELMALHRSKAMCSACHSRMDPLGLALENFNAMGGWREAELKQPIDATGTLITGEPFHDIRDLKRILKEEHRVDFYRCLTEKLLTYALGRGLEYYDVETVDRIVERLEQQGGRFSALLLGVVESAPFQKRRNDPSRPAGSSVSSGRSHEPNLTRHGPTHDAIPSAR